MQQALEVSLFERRSLPHTGHGAPAEPLALVPFLNLAREISALFVPPKMRPGFRTALERSLLVAARQRHAHDVLYQGAFSPAGRSFAGRFEDGQIDRRWVFGAALGSAVSIAGLVAIVWRYRSKAA